MASPDPAVRLRKRKRTARKAGPLVEGDDASLDTAMYQEIPTGSSRQKILVPVRLDKPGRDRNGPEPAPECETQSIGESNIGNDWINEDIPQTTQRKNRSYYMKEYVSRINDILQAIQAREALPELHQCSECRISDGKWRCQDCSLGQLLCRTCMRQSHIVNPFHRISRWTGSYFREAALWEVGVYLTVKHQEAPDICPHLKWQQDILEQFQNQRDYDDKYRSEATSSRFVGNPGKADLAMSDPGPEPGEEAIRDATVMQLLDRLVEGHNIEDLLEEDEDNDTIQREAEIKDDEAGAFGFVGYIGDPSGTEPGLAGQPTAGLEPHIPVVPQQDALNNQYVQVVHMNGVHHIALVSCSCQGHEKNDHGLDLCPVDSDQFHPNPNIVYDRRVG